MLSSMLRLLGAVPEDGARRRKASPRVRPLLEQLESRLVPYALAGSSWGNTSVTFSFLPDGTTTDNGAPSNLQASLSALGSPATWQKEYARALATWAASSPLNFHLVADGGQAVGTSGQAQGDPRFGDIRFGGYVRTDGYCAYTWYPSGTTKGGDSFLNTGDTFHIGTYPDLYSVMLHETGHSIGLAHSALNTAVMYATITGVYTGLSADDIAGVQAIYGARKADAYDAAASNDTFATSSALTVNSSGVASANADLTTTADLDYYHFTAPSGANGNLTVTLDAGDYSLLVPSVTVYDSNQNVLGQTSATTYGSTLTLNLTGITAGQTYTVKVDRPSGQGYFGIGAYSLTNTFGLNQPPPPPPPPPPSGLSPDRYDVNSSTSTAANLGKLGATTQGNLTLDNATNVDYFTFIANTSGNYTISTVSTQADGSSGQVALTVMDKRQKTLASMTGAAGTNSVTVALAAGSKYYVKFISPTGNQFTYSLTIGANVAGGGADLGDELPNSAIGLGPTAGDAVAPQALPAVSLAKEGASSAPSDRRMDPAAFLNDGTGRSVKLADPVARTPVAVDRLTIPTGSFTGAETRQLENALTLAGATRLRHAVLLNAMSTDNDIDNNRAVDDDMLGSEVAFREDGANGLHRSSSFAAEESTDRTVTVAVNARQTAALRDQTGDAEDQVAAEMVAQ